MAATLPAVFHTEDDTIYALPPRPLAHLMRTDEIVNLDASEHPEVLAKYVAALDDVSRPALRSAWSGTNIYAMTGAVRPGDVVSVQVNADR
jgi:hypothetical protein